ncbi:MAG: hypothetical protein IT303_02980 [Dehalococcoidia bacterium]|nr:hypothetical protein [Dehalococcoidia bacterium]
MARFLTRRSTFAIAAILGLVSAVWIAVAANRGGNGGSIPELDVPQSATASDAGITISLLAARFSGTATFLAVRVDPSEYAAEQGTRVFGLAVPAEGLLASTVQPLLLEGQGLPSDPDTTAVLRLSPVVEAGGQRLVITAIDVTGETGNAVRVNGRWELPFDLPTGLSDKLRTEVLRPLVVAEDRGITVRGVSAIRSTTETLVTVEIESTSAVELITQPLFFNPGLERMPGALAEEKDGGRLRTYSFPATPFGASGSMLIQTLVRREDSSATTEQLDLNSLMSRHGSSGKAGESLAIGPGDVDVVGGGDSRLLSVVFQDAQFGTSEYSVIQLTLRGNWDRRHGELLSATGEALVLDSQESSYRKDLAGVVTEGTTVFSFRYDRPEDIAGVVQLTYPAPSELIQGRWEVQFEPMSR